MADKETPKKNFNVLRVFAAQVDIQGYFETEKEDCTFRWWIMVVIKQIVKLFFGHPHCHNQTQHLAQITSLYERLAVSRIKEEWVHVGM